MEDRNELIVQKILSQTMLKEIHISQICIRTGLSNDEAVAIVDHILLNNPGLGSFDHSTQWIQVNPIDISRRQKILQRTHYLNFGFQFVLGIIPLVIGIILGPNKLTQVIFSPPRDMTLLDMISLSLIFIGTFYIILSIMLNLGGKAEDDIIVRNGAISLIAGPNM